MGGKGFKVFGTIEHPSGQGIVLEGGKVHGFAFLGGG